MKMLILLFLVHVGTSLDKDKSSNQEDTESDRETSLEPLESDSTSTGSFYLNDTKESNEDEESSKEEDESEKDESDNRA